MTPMTPMETSMLQNSLIACVLFAAGVGFLMRRNALVFSAVKKIANPFGIYAALGLLLVLPSFFNISSSGIFVCFFMVIMPTLLVWVV